MTKIAGLIAEITKHYDPDSNNWMGKAFTALRTLAQENERLTIAFDKLGKDWIVLQADLFQAKQRIRELEAAVKAPLPDEIAGLIARLVSNEASAEERTTASAMITAALRALAQENERLKAKLLEPFGPNTAAGEHIRELEAERNAIKEELGFWRDYAGAPKKTEAGK